MLSSAPAPIRTTLSVVTDPAKARLTVDGMPRWTSPLTIRDLAAGQHPVTATSDTGSVERSFNLDSGGAVSLVFSLPKAATPAVGWLKVEAPFEVEILEHAERIGTSGTSKLMLPAGRHEIRDRKSVV